MKQPKWTETEEPVRGRQGATGDERSMIVYEQGKSDKNPVLTIVIPETLMRAAGLRVGDAVKCVEGDGMVAVLRDAAGGHHLSSRTTGKGDSVSGKAKRACITRKLTPKLRAVWLGTATHRAEKALTGDGWVAIRAVGAGGFWVEGTGK